MIDWAALRTFRIIQCTGLTSLWESLITSPRPLAIVELMIHIYDHEYNNMIRHTYCLNTFLRRFNTVEILNIKVCTLRT